MSEHATTMIGGNATGTSAFNQPAKMKINPLQLLTALSILLNPKGGIKSLEEVKRVAGLMGKYSKKLVSKCIYLNILQATEETLLDQFFTDSGWDLMSTWLADSIGTSNWPLTKQILNLLLVSPVTVERLKQNNTPKMVKEISKECEDTDVKTLADKIVQNWKAIVVQGVMGSDITNATNEPEQLAIEIPLSELKPIVKEPQVEISTEQPSVAEETSTCIPPVTEEPPVRAPAKRGRGGKAGRGRGRPKGRPKVEVPSYADLLSQDLDSLPMVSETPINIIIRNGPNVLAKVSSHKANKKTKKPNRPSIDSSDSDDNVPLSLIRKEGQASINLTDDTETSAEVISIESSDSTGLSEESSPNTEKATLEDQVKDKKDKSVPKLGNNVEKGKPNSKDANSTESQSNDEKTKLRSHRSKDKESNRQKDRISNKAKDSDINKTKDSDRRRDKGKDSDRNKGKSKESERSRDKRKDSDKTKDKSRDKDRKSDHRSKDNKDRSQEKSKDKSDRHHSSRDKRKEEEKTKDNKSNQKQLDQATLNKVKPLSTEGLAKIPRKPSSFLDALGAADVSEQKKPAIKTKSCGFRNTGLLDETINRPGLAGKRTAAKNTSPPLKRPRPPELDFADKRIKSSVSSDPSALDRPGGVKLISPKRPAIADDGGFMAALTAASPTDRKRISRKRRSSDAESKPEPNKIPKLEQEETSVPEKVSPVPEEPILSPTIIRPTLNFYTERVQEEVEPKKEKSPVVEETPSDPSSPVDESMESPESDEKDPEENNMLPEPAVPAPAQEDYETIEVLHTSSSHHLKGVLVYHHGTTNRRRKKSVQWKSEENLTQIFLFPMDENERVSVNTLKFQDMMQKDRAFEKDMMGRHRGRFGSPDLNPNSVDTVTEFLPWKLYPIHLPEESTVVYGCKSNEKHVQAQREHLTMQQFFHPSMRPDTPSEPDPEMVTRAETIIVPLKDVTASDSMVDHRHIPWPEPVVNPPEMPFVPAAPQPMPSHDGGHWIIGSHPTPPRFGGDMFNGPGVCVPAPHPGPVFPRQNFGNNMRGPCPPGGWGPPPNDFVGPGPGPHVMMQGGPPNHMGMAGPNMGQIGPGMGGPGMRQPGNQGMGQPGGPGMGMPNLGMPGRGGPRFKRGNWGPQHSSRPCKHFMNGHCRNGNNCRFAHNQQR